LCVCVFVCLAVCQVDRLSVPDQSQVSRQSQFIVPGQEYSIFFTGSRYEMAGEQSKTCARPVAVAADVAAKARAGAAQQRAQSTVCATRVCAGCCKSLWLLQILVVAANPQGNNSRGKPQAVWQIARAPRPLSPVPLCSRSLLSLLLSHSPFAHFDRKRLRCRCSWPWRSSALICKVRKLRSVQRLQWR